jgi:NADPH:quinone reductase-like Zn-dependent oxidoreductase
VAKKSVKRALNLQDLLCLTVFIYIIYLLTILLRFRLPGLKSIYLL